MTICVATNETVSDASKTYLSITIHTYYSVTSLLAMDAVLSLLDTIFSIWSFNSFISESIHTTYSFKRFSGGCRISSFEQQSFGVIYKRESLIGCVSNSPFSFLPYHELFSFLLFLLPV